MGAAWPGCLVVRDLRSFRQVGFELNSASREALVFNRYDLIETDGPKHGAVRVLNVDPVASNEMAVFLDCLRRREKRIAPSVLQRGFKIREFYALRIRHIDIVQQVEVVSWHSSRVHRAEGRSRT
mgnify:CR=1 FL=1